MSKVSKIVRCVVSEEFIWKEFYGADLELADGTTGQALVKSRDRFSAGDEIEYEWTERKQPQHKDKIKVIQKMGDKKWGGKGGGGKSWTPPDYFAQELAKVPGFSMSYALRMMECTLPLSLQDKRVTGDPLPSIDSSEKLFALQKAMVTKLTTQILELKETYETVK